MPGRCGFLPALGGGLALLAGGVSAEGASGVSVSPDPPPPGVVPVFWHRYAGSKCYRIPTMLKTKAGTLLAFAEQRLHGCGDSGAHNIVVRRSFDDGQTWEENGGEPIVAVNGTDDKIHSLSNANPVEMVLPSGKRAILLRYDTKNNPIPFLFHGQNRVIWSFDEGKTWKNDRDISTHIPWAFRGCLAGPGQGVVSQKTGTVFFACYNAIFGVLLSFSSDLGKTWQHSAAHHGASECSLAFFHENNDELLAMNCRSTHIFRHRYTREQVVWGLPLDGAGATPQPKILRKFCAKNADDGTEVSDPNCQGSIVAMAPGSAGVGSAEGGAELFFMSHDNSTEKRERMAIRGSVDGGRSWGAGTPVYSGPSGYSQLADLGGGRVGLLFEWGKPGNWAYDNIGFLSVSAKTVVEGQGAAEPDEETEEERTAVYI